MTCSPLDLPELQLLAHGVAIDFLFENAGPNGTVLEVDVSTAIEAACFALFRKPGRDEQNRPIYVRTAIVLATPGTNRMRYVVEDGFLDRAGRWDAQAFVTLTGTPNLYVPSSITSFQVLPNLRPMTVAPLLPGSLTARGAAPDPIPFPLSVPDVEVS